jgi:hypothetical protein
MEQGRGLVSLYGIISPRSKHRRRKPSSRGRTQHHSQHETQHTHATTSMGYNKYTYRQTHTQIHKYTPHMHANTDWHTSHPRTPHARFVNSLIHSTHMKTPPHTADTRSAIAAYTRSATSCQPCTPHQEHSRIPIEQEVSEEGPLIQRAPLVPFPHLL